MRLLSGVLVFTLCLVGGSRASRASADASAIVLGLRSVEGDDDVANAMTEALRVAAHSVAGWKVEERPVSMAQMSLAHGCDDIDAACLSEIAKGLAIELIVYGTVRRTSARSEHDYQVSLSIFDASTGSIGATETDTLPRAELKSPAAISARADALVKRLTGGDATAGRATGPASMRGRPDEPGTSTTATDEDEGDEAAAPLDTWGAEPEPKRKSLRWLGYTLLGVSGASLVGVGASWFVINNINGNATYKKYRGLVPSSVDDICEAAETLPPPVGITASELQEVRDKCGTGGAFEVLQWVFLGTAVVSGGIGAYLLVKEGRRDASASGGPARLALQPRVGRREIALHATLRF